MKSTTKEINRVKLVRKYLVKEKYRKRSQHVLQPNIASKFKNINLKQEQCIVNGVLAERITASIVSGAIIELIKILRYLIYNP